VRTDGSDLTQLTTDGEWAYPVWSPDAAQIAAGVVNANKTRITNLFQILKLDEPLTARPPERIALPGEGHFVPNSWSPDGRAIAGQDRVSTPSIAVFTIADRTLRKLADFGEWPVWLPDSRRVLVVSKRREFHVFDTVAGTERMVFSVPRDTLGPPRLSRDGRSAYFSRRITEADIWLVDFK
jgi:Tol biopolymer transport system component